MELTNNASAEAISKANSPASQSDPNVSQEYRSSDVSLFISQNADEVDEILDSIFFSLEKVSK